MPGIRPDLEANWLFVRGDKWDTKEYHKAGGDPAKRIAHLLSDDSLIFPLWEPDKLRERIKFYREMDVRYFVAPDFSAWLDMPLALQFYQIYKSACLVRDLSNAGIGIIPNPEVFCLPEHFDIYNGWYPDGTTTPIALDLCHTPTLKWGHANQMLWRNAEQLKKKWPNAPVWIWARTVTPVKYWLARMGPCHWIPSRAYLQDRLYRRRKSLLSRGESHGKG